LSPTTNSDVFNRDTWFSTMSKIASNVLSLMRSLLVVTSFKNSKSNVRRPLSERGWYIFASSYVKFFIICSSVAFLKVQLKPAFPAKHWQKYFFWNWSYRHEPA
jgi:hypothetical protein